MNSLRTATMRFASLASSSAGALGKRDFTRSLWHMTKKPVAAGEGGSDHVTVLNLHKPSINCTCGCNVHTKCERELVEFLTEEIVAERKVQKGKSVPSTLDGFSVKLTGADVELTKQTDKEKVVVSFNVNHSVDSEEEPEINPNADKPELGEMRSKPQFEVDIIKGNSTLSFTCTFLQGEAQEGEYNDIFSIDEMAIFEGEWNDKVYAVAGDVLDGYLYDLLINLLEEKGISQEFAEKLSDLATAHEHTSYIGLLEKLSKFTAGGK
ncbi:complement component 1 Q subcomponent-binding protein, mitochondrial [Drosophila gunungcola]|uniref:complement component 1 Q subcomponent-binding protein, mitochondrial n=1 Tax=Drosophila elegans TaxID=30023 RepID=UPI0007E630C1|nr:complement component 1 Q subcomponent-binding protein, mitochondrial [Drosophila elegans]XP_052838279.1 complement component 1 Q subcomponent-binding protein, mitochondrial [Drosophila gunungcola]